jgi:hypothetical protein
VDIGFGFPENSVTQVINMSLLNFCRYSAEVFQLRVVICSVPFTRSHTLHCSFWCSEHCNDGWLGWQVRTSHLYGLNIYYYKIILSANVCRLCLCLVKRHINDICTCSSCYAVNLFFTEPAGLTKLALYSFLPFL